ncbi:hypothetical protein AHALO_1201 [Malaciobacter halophilus]|nr:pimelyl-ACP methyl ester esterase BioV [Malaciobacter halophilus]AXH09578.1 hypothetical protein AHALO_1201 [Malaciobacter halophilus]
MTSNYYSGFCLSKEDELFSDYIIKNDFTISGFSYGAIKAFNEALNTQKRVDLLQLFSPAFFQTKDKKYKRIQLMFFKKDAKEYCKNFLNNISYPKTIDTSKYFQLGTFEQLDELLNYEWKKDELKKLIKKGTKIEVYLGAKDKIIQSYEAKEFFKEFATVYFINDAGHIL